MTNEPDFFKKIRYNLLKNSLLIMIGRIICAALSITIVPIIISKLGIAGYGTWETIFAAATLCTMFNSAVSSTLLWQVSTAFGANNLALANRMLSIGIFASILIFVVIFPVMFIGRHSLVAFFNVPAEYRAAATIMFPLAAGLLSLACINDALGSFVNGCLRAGIVTNIHTLGSIIGYLLIIVFLFSGLNLESMLLGFTGNYIITGVFLYFTARRIAGKLTLWPAIPTTQELAILRSYFSFTMIGRVTAAIRDQIPRLILSSFASTEWAGYYGIAARIASLNAEVNNFFYVPMISIIGNLSSKSSNSLSWIYRDMMIMTAIVVGIMQVSLGSSYYYLIWLWLNRSIPETSPILFFLLAQYAFAIILAAPGTAFCKGTGAIHIETMYLVINLVVNIILLVLLLPLLGAIGGVAAASLSWILSCTWFAWYFSKKFDLVESTLIGFKSIVAIGITIASVNILTFHSGWLVQSPSRLLAFKLLVLQSLAASLIYIILLFFFRVLSFKMLNKLKNMVFPGGAWVNIKQRVNAFKTSN